MKRDRPLPFLNKFFFQMQRLLVIGGQAYHGPTAARDLEVTVLTAFELFKRVGDSIQVVTGGMPGIPDEFARAWRKAGGTHILCVVSEEYEKDYRLDFPYMVVGATQEKRR